ncbi:hypothetical protein G4B88_008039 [Cannabis sativa]|uniref:Transposase-associated domain-containing protein n=1 Tax=Cannabis sativa TaxID=3483 RepID=A0A7J6I754_CANSA|nr:hypothetical protein G4B88_008039 [Cannabis sativa]
MHGEQKKGKRDQVGESVVQRKSECCGDEFSLRLRVVKRLFHVQDWTASIKLMLILNLISTTARIHIQNYTLFYHLSLLREVSLAEMSIDKSWMTIENRLSVEYIKGVKAFVERAKAYVNTQGQVRCPCGFCLNRSFQDLYIVEHHLVQNGIQQTYTIWSYYGESFQSQQYENNDLVDDGDDDSDEMANVLADICGHDEFGETTLDNMQFHPYDDAEAEDVNANVDELLQVRVNNEVLVDDGDFEDDTLGEYEDEESHLEDDDDTSDYE